MIKCVILIEEVKGGLSMAVIPEAIDTTQLERDAWHPYNIAFGAVMEWQNRTAASNGGHLLSGGEEVRALVEERLKNLEPLRRKKKRKRKA